MRTEPSVRQITYVLSFGNLVSVACTRERYCIQIFMPVSVGPAQPRENRLLAALPKSDYERLLPQLADVSFALGEVVYEFGGQLDYVYFPTTAIISLLYTMENGSSAEMGLTGNDGVVGIALFMGGGTMPNRAVVQSAGQALS